MNFRTAFRVVSELCNNCEWICLVITAIIESGTTSFDMINRSNDIKVGAIMQKLIQRLANLSAIGMFLILAMGALVTKADAGRGCGDEWPLCHGKFVPAHTISS